MTALGQRARSSAPRARRAPRSKRRGRLMLGMRLAACAGAVVAFTNLTGGSSHASATTSTVPTATPIKHVVFLMMENHSFDNVLGAWCVQTKRCNGSTTGELPGGKPIALEDASDIIAGINHTTSAIEMAIDGGKMDGFANVGGCQNNGAYPCLAQYQPSQIPNTIALANAFGVSDNTFEDLPLASWTSHMDAVATTTDGFVGGGIPSIGSKGVLGPGWGCDSGDNFAWEASGSTTSEQVPSCVPDHSLSTSKYPYGGAYEATPVPHVGTIMDELDAKGLSWRIYAGLGGTANSNGYGWAICPTFADCIDTNDATNMVANTQIVTDAQSGNLPSFSVVTPTQAESQHNNDSMVAGDNWIGQVLSAIQGGPEWSSTAVFLTWDDCGCFYDHVAPPAGMGTREPMIIVSPYTKAHHDDKNLASFASVLAFTEHDFGLPALSSLDAKAYDFSDSFDYSQTPLKPVKMVKTPIPKAEQRYLAAHPTDPRDPS